MQPSLTSPRVATVWPSHLMHPHTVWDWTTNAFFNEFDGSDRVFVRSASSTAHPRRTPSHSLGEPKA